MKKSKLQGDDISLSATRMMLREDLGTSVSVSIYFCKEWDEEA